MYRVSSDGCITLHINKSARMLLFIFVSTYKGYLLIMDTPYCIRCAALLYELKELSKQAKFVIRTGEFTPYPNILLRAGVSFAV